MGEETCCNPLGPSGTHSCRPYEEVYCVCVCAALPHWRKGNKKEALLTKMKGVTGSGDKRDHGDLGGSVYLFTWRHHLWQGWGCWQTCWSPMMLSVLQFLLILEVHTNISNKAENILSTLEDSIFLGHKSGIWCSGPKVYCPTMRFLCSGLDFKAQNSDFKMWSSDRWTLLSSYLQKMRRKHFHPNNNNNNDNDKTNILAINGLKLG